MATAQDIIERLKAKARPDQLEGMARYGIAITNRLGVAVPEMRGIAEGVGKDHKLALALWRTGVADARIVAALIAEVEKLTEKQMELWVGGFDSWDVCDQVCMNLFDRTPLAWKKVRDWAVREEEFVRRAAFAMIAALASHDKEAEDGQFTDLFGLMEAAATDERNYVKKAVNWALRGVGKRNVRLNKAAIQAAERIGGIDSRAARWIASDALRELRSEAVEARLKK